MFFRSRGANREEEEDLTQETFFRAIRALGSFKPERALISWILTIARNLLIDRWREKDRWRTMPMLPPVETPSLENSVVERLSLQDLLIELPPEDRLLIDLRIIRNVPSNEVGEILGISEGNVRIRLFRVLQRLRNRIERENPDEG